MARNLNRIRIQQDDANSEDDDLDIPESIRWRLFLARQLALLSRKAV